MKIDRKKEEFYERQKFRMRILIVFVLANRGAASG
jgi:hypothetical protein